MADKDKLEQVNGPAFHGFGCIKDEKTKSPGGLVLPVEDDEILSEMVPGPHILEVINALG